jgi:GNAT superfamily N-acetyltransferase
VELTTYTGAQAGKLESPLRDIYAAAFTAPPFLEAEEQADLFAQEFRSELGAPGFACCVAHDQERVVGFAYGYTAVVGDPPSGWERRLVAAIGPQGAEHWIRGQFAVAWFAVHPDAQGGGIGARLYDLLLQTTDCPRAWLVTHDLDTPARRFYQHRGWRELGRGPLGWRGEERLVLGLDLPRAPRPLDRTRQPR